MDHTKPCLHEFLGLKHRRQVSRETAKRLALDRSNLDLAVEARYYLSDLDYTGFRERHVRFFRFDCQAEVFLVPRDLEGLSRELPANRYRHVRGYLAPTRIYYFQGSETGLVLPPRLKVTQLRRQPGYFARQLYPRPCIFHSQPTVCAYSDIPSCEDLHDFLQRRHRLLIVVGREFVSFLEKTDRTREKVLDLFKWEERPGNRYQMERLRRRHAGKYSRWPHHQPFMNLEHECRERYAWLASARLG